MKTLLKISLLLNLGFIVLFAFLLRWSPDAKDGSVLPVGSEAGVHPVQAGKTEPSPPQAAQPKPFDWSLVESTDYRHYIANLRRIGCPEQTIRDIITADLRSLFAPKRDALQRRLTAYDQSIAGSAARRGIESSLEALRNEESAALATLLGPEVASAKNAGNATSPSRSDRRNPENAPVSVPLVFQPVDSPERRLQPAAKVSVPLVFQQVDAGALELSDRQIQAISNMQQWFIDQLGGPDQDPSDPAYRERWLKTQPQMDDMVRGTIGVNAFEDYQLAARASQQEAQENQNH